MTLQVGIDTMFLCFLVDEKNNKGGHMFASQALKNMVGEVEKDGSSLEAAEKLQRNKTFRRDGDLHDLKKSETAHERVKTMRANTLRGGNPVGGDWPIEVPPEPAQGRSVD